MTDSSSRADTVSSVEEAVKSGSTVEKACGFAGISRRTYERWGHDIKTMGKSEDKRPLSVHPTPKNKLSAQERQMILDVCNSKEFCDSPPCQIVPVLADRGIYIASDRTFYRVLESEKQLHHRGRGAAPKRKSVTTHCATGPNQVWMWDITYLKTRVRGLFYYLYLFMDLYDRSIVGFEVYEEESAYLAAKTLKRISLAQGRLSTQTTVLHSDNGAPMKAVVMHAMIYRLGVMPSHSRPRVSNDNPYAESIFKTMKYRPNYPSPAEGGFSTLEEARRWVAKFVAWYNYEHLHSGLKFLTPAQRRSGEGDEILKKRHEVYERAKERHPERWHGRQTRNWELDSFVYLNPEKNTA